MCPGLVHREVWHRVFGELAVQLIALAVEDRAEPAPTSMPFHPARHTPQLPPRAAACCLVVPHTCLTCVKSLHAAVGQVVPPLAFQAAGGLLAFFSVNPLLADQQAIGKNLVGDFGGGGDEDDVTTHLLTVPSIWGRDPMRAQQGAHG